jgi:Tfp pilus assembly protein PilO
MSPSVRARRPWYAALRVPLLAVLGLNVAVFLVYTLPHMLMVRNMSSRAAELRADVAHEKQEADSARAAASAIRQNQEDAKRFFTEQVGVRKALLLPMIQFVEKTASSQGLAPHGRSYSHQTVKALSLVRFSIVMPMAGNYAQVVRFLGALERAPQFLVVDQVQLKSATTPSVAELSFVVSAYFRLEAGDNDAD